MEHIFHIVERGTWALAQSAGEYRPESLQSEGFVHFSFVDQVEPTANLLYADAVNPVVVEFDPQLLPVPVAVEDTADRSEQFPHVYAAIPVGAAVAVHNLPRGADGRYHFAAPDGAG